MNITLSFIRILFTVLSLFLMLSFWNLNRDENSGYFNVLGGIVSGLALAGAMISMEALFKRINLRSFNIAIVGLFCGYLLALSLDFLLSTLLHGFVFDISPSVVQMSRIGLYLFCIYLGMVMASRASEELYVSLPFVKFKPISHEKKDVLLDSSMIQDPRIIDIASSGLVDHHLVLPRFLLRDLYQQLDSSDEGLKGRARCGLDVIKRLETIPTLDLRYIDTDFPELHDLEAKILRLARLLDCYIMTADINKIQQSTLESIEGIKIINIHTLAQALKPLSQSGESINIKIQRYGKESGQGVGYLDNGTMVVVNGGADFMGKTIRTQVLSIKHTASGRMIFCNALVGADNEVLAADHTYLTPH